MRHLSTSEGTRIIEALEALPEQIEEVLKLSDQMKAIAKKYASVPGMLFFGRQFNYPIALEAALKLKEITYLFAEGHPSAELKHGIIALVRPDLPSVFITPYDAVFSKLAYQRVLEGWQGVFRHVLLELMPVSELKVHFDPVLGRPSKELYSMAGLVLIKEFFDWTNEEAVGAYLFHTDVQFAVLSHFSPNCV